MSQTLPAAAPAGELALYERVRQLQSLIEAARQVAAGASAAAIAASAGSAYGATEGAAASTTAGGGDFAAALQAATSAAYAPQGATGAASLTDEPAGGEGAQYEALIDAAAQRNGVEPALLHGLIEQESGFDADAQSSAGASGLTQLMPSTAASLGVADPLDPAESIEGGARYLGGLLREFGGNSTDALAAYNAGPAAVQRFGGVPPYAETEQYVSRVLGYAEAYGQSPLDSAAAA